VRSVRVMDGHGTRGGGRAVRVGVVRSRKRNAHEGRRTSPTPRAPGDVDAIRLTTGPTTSGWFASFDPLPARGGVGVESPDRSCLGTSAGFGFTGCFAGPNDVATFDLGDRDDYVELGARRSTSPGAPPLFPKAVVHGGAGIDTVRYTEEAAAKGDVLGATA
jgi:hypothetical protein